MLFHIHAQMSVESVVPHSLHCIPVLHLAMAQRMLESEDLNKHPADLNADYVPITMLPIIGADEAMVRSYLKHFLVEAANTKEFEPYINDVYLRHLFAETKIVNGLGEPEQDLPGFHRRQRGDGVGWGQGDGDTQNEAVPAS